ncbi:thiamine-phosphate kinase [Nocardia cyriacigeorgica]|uniref:thiamine-phosphate kinase n=1 Tax=Nocardia cyriacigeorgica TaxID=135487 RepID=UPI0009DAED4E|nr:thiamine-phosphate kinase [Nocardia cyriacigeorgica]MBF6423941.1 thiamine-phosphate kinase [Nocardia cyriacigeorgica]
MSSSTQPRTVAELGEFALIERINSGRTQTPAVLLGPGDDAALLAAPGGRFVVTTDMLVQDRHFRLDWSSPYEIGRKAIAQNAADVVAMGAVPTGFVVALGCPGETPVALIDGLADGLWAEAAVSGGSIAGGDLVRDSHLVLSVTAFGDPIGPQPVLRSGARAGDVIAVAGRLGWSAAGLAALSAGAGERTEFADAVAAHRVPSPPYRAVLDAMTAGLAPHALTDVSDGLLADLGHIATASNIAIDLDGGALIDRYLEELAEALDADAAQWILTGGEDHAFAAAWPAGTALPAGWTRIGVVGAGQGVTVDGVRPAGRGGWESFAGADSAQRPGSR